MMPETRCMVAGCPNAVAAGLHVGTLAGFELSVQICAYHAEMVAAMRERLPENLRDWSGRLS